MFMVPPAMLRALLPVAALVALSACSGSRPAAEPAPPDTVSYPETPAPVPAPVYEPAPTPTPAPAPVYEPTPAPAPARQVQGFRVQIYASESAAGGEQARADADSWWAAEQRRSGFRAPLDAYVVRLDGLYKVRMARSRTVRTPRARSRSSGRAFPTRSSCRTS